MRWRGISHVEFAVLDYDESIFYDAMLGWLGYHSFSSMNTEYQSIYYMTRPVNPQYWAGYYAVFFDDPINGIHWELAWVPKVPSPRQVWASYRALHAITSQRPDPATFPPLFAMQAMRKLPSRRFQ
jgi:hypothetical protein